MRRPKGCHSIVVDNYSKVRQSGHRGRRGMQVGPSAPPPYTEQPTGLQQQTPMGFNPYAQQQVFLLRPFLYLSQFN